MAPDDIAKAAGALVDAQDSGIPVDALSPAPADHDEAYAIQDAGLARRAAPPDGWKVGATSLAAQQMLGTDRPFAGPVLAGHRLAAPATVTTAEAPMVLVEGEFAFVMSADLPPRNEPFTRDEVALAVGELRPAIEVVGNRFESGMAAGILNNIADNGANRRLVVGEAVEGWAELDLAASGASMSVDGSETGRGTGADVMGHPLDSLTWLANHLRERGQTLRSGQAVTTGSCTGIALVPVNGTAVADFGPLGRVEVRYQQA